MASPVGEPARDSGAEPAPLVCAGTEASAGQDQSHKLLLRSPIPSARFIVRKA